MVIVQLVLSFKLQRFNFDDHRENHDRLILLTYAIAGFVNSFCARSPSRGRDLQVIPIHFHPLLSGGERVRGLLQPPNDHQTVVQTVVGDSTMSSEHR